jgi:uncharacterized protein (TIGR02246 family)
MTTLSKILLFFGLIAAVFFGFSDREKDSTNEAELKSAFEAYVEAFNKKDYKQLASMWEEDAMMKNPITEETVEGREEIEEYFKKKFEANNAESVKVVIDSIVFPEPDKARIKSHFQITDKGETTMAGKMATDYIKEDGKWYILRYAEFEKLPVISRFDKLDHLNWLVGDWVDASEDVEITSKWQWDRNKNFLTEHFTMKVLDDPEFEGFQMIGWDPAREKMRVWLFDSDGGFGEGTLIQQESSWYAKMVFTLPDGQIGTATNVYTKEDDNTYTFSSIGRDIEGEMLPDVGPYKIVRK